MNPLPKLFSRLTVAYYHYVGETDEADALLREAQETHRNRIADAQQEFDAALLDCQMPTTVLMDVERYLQSLTVATSISIDNAQTSVQEPSATGVSCTEIVAESVESAVPNAQTSITASLNPCGKWDITELPVPEPTPESTPELVTTAVAAVGAALIFGSNRADIHARLKSVRESIPLSPMLIAEALGWERKRLTNMLGRPDFYKLESLQTLTSQLETLRDQLTPGKSSVMMTIDTPDSRRQDRDASVARTRALYQQARERYDVYAIAERAGINAKRLANLLSPSTFCALESINQLGDVLELMLAEPVQEKPLTCSVCAEPATQTTCHSCITAKAAQAKRESAVKQEAKPKPRIMPDPGRIVAVKPAPTTPTPTPKTFEFSHWTDFAVREIEAGKRQYPNGFSLIRHCIGGDIDANVWECVPVNQRLTAQQALYLRYVLVAGKLSPEKPYVIAIPHRDAAQELLEYIQREE